AGAFGSEVAPDGDYDLIVGFDEQLGFDFNVHRVEFVFRYDPTTDRWRQVHVIDVGEVSLGAAHHTDACVPANGSAPEQEPGAVYVVYLPDNGQALSLGH